MGRAYGAKEFSVRFGIRDQSETAVGTILGTDAHALTPVEWRLNSLNDIAFDGGYNRSELSRAGLRAHRNTDIINHYGSGTWTWDFDYAVDNEVAIQNLMQLIYPSTGTAVATSLTIPANPSVESYAHGAGGTTNCTADIIIKNPDDDEDRLLHSAVLQNLTLSMAAGTNAGTLNASGQFYSGYKPGIADYDALMSAPSTAITGPRGLFNCETTTIGGTAVAVDSFSITISNPAVRTGFQGASGEADGYSRASTFEITGSINVKADDYVMGLIDSWQSNTTVAIVMEAGTASELSFNLPACNMSGVNLSLNDEGNMIEIPFRATSGTGSGNLLVMKYT